MLPRHQSSCCVLSICWHRDEPGQCVMGTWIWWWIHPEVHCMVSNIWYIKQRSYQVSPKGLTCFGLYCDCFVFFLPGSSKHPEGNMNGRLCLCRHLKTTCWWLGYLLALAISSVSFLRINWALDLSVKLFLCEHKVCKSELMFCFGFPSLSLFNVNTL